MKLGIAYSGDVQDTGDLKQKIEHAIQNNIPYIQLRFKDIVDFIMPPQINYQRLEEFRKLVESYQGEISIHLMSPKWDGTKLIGINKNLPTSSIINLMQNYLVPLGIKLYTIHPYFDKKTFEQLNEAQQYSVLSSLASMFADLAATGATIAIENMPCKDPDVKTCSFGMELDDLSKIVSLTREAFVLNGGTTQAARDQIGITFDTGHATILDRDLSAKSDVIAEWIGMYHSDIKCIHFCPAIHEHIIQETDSKETEIDYDKNVYMFNTVSEQLSLHSVDIPTYIEAHASLQTLGELYEINKMVDELPKQR